MGIVEKEKNKQWYLRDRKDELMLNKQGRELCWIWGTISLLVMRDLSIFSKYHIQRPHALLSLYNFFFSYKFSCLYQYDSIWSRLSCWLREREETFMKLVEAKMMMMMMMRKKNRIKLNNFSLFNVYFISCETFFSRDQMEKLCISFINLYRGLIFRFFLFTYFNYTYSYNTLVCKQDSKDSHYILKRCLCDAMIIILQLLIIINGLVISFPFILSPHANLLKRSWKSQ